MNKALFELTDKFPEDLPVELPDFTQLLLEAERRVAKKSPFYMSKFVMGRGNRHNGKLWGWNRHHVEMGKTLWWGYSTRWERPAGTLLYFEWCRGSRKSTLLQAAALCFMVDDPNEQFLWDGDVLKKTVKKTGMLKAMFEDEYFCLLFGDLRGDKWREGEFTLKRVVKSSDATLTASGLDSSKTSAHYGIIFGDDLQTDDNADSPLINEQVKTNFRQYQSLHRGKPCPLTIVAGTRWGFRDLGALIAEMAEDEVNRGLRKSIFISRRAAYKINKNGMVDRRFSEFPEEGVGLDLESLKRMELTMRPMLFSFNILLQPYSAEEAYFRKEWVHHHSRTVSDMPPETVYWLIVDPAGEGKWRGADHNAFVICGVTPRAEIYVMETVNKHMSQVEIFGEIIRINSEYPGINVLVETYWQQHKLLAWLKDEANKALVAINWVKFKMDYRKKPIRIMALQPYFQMGKVFWRKEHVELEDQALQYTGRDEKGVEDDLIDALAHLLQKMSTPIEQKEGKWYLQDNWADTAQYKDLQFKGKEPSYMMVQVKAAEERAKQLRMRHSERRFAPRGLRP